MLCSAHKLAGMVRLWGMCQWVPPQSQSPEGQKALAQERPALAQGETEKERHTITTERGEGVGKGEGVGGGGAGAGAGAGGGSGSGGVAAMGCYKSASFGLASEGIRRFCAEHRDKMKHVYLHEIHSKMRPRKAKPP